MKNRKKTCGRRASAAAAVVLAMISLPAVAPHPLYAESERNADDGRGVLRYAPTRGTLEPISAEELKVGCVYSHFSKRLSRRVWSYVQANGEFWYALGEGTMLEAWRLDIRATVGEQLEMLAKVAPRLYQELQQRGTGRVYLRLTSEGRWVIAEGASFPTIYNAETGYRWERHSGRFIPVSAGPWQYRWEVQDGTYVPAGPWRPAARSTGPIGPATLPGCPCR
jgi:hypothetical protein